MTLLFRMGDEIVHSSRFPHAAPRAVPFNPNNCTICLPSPYDETRNPHYMNLDVEQSNPVTNI
jgi:hypothetical protein